MLPTILLYVLAIIVICIVALLLFRKYHSLRDIRRKRNILIYGVFALILILLIFQLDLVARRADVGYGITAISGKVYPGKVNEVALYCSNRGSRSANFYIVLTSVNASFNIEDQQDYLSVNSTMVKVPFALSENWFSANADSKVVFFTVSDNVAGFSFFVDIENRAFGGLDTPGGVWFVRYAWNATTNCFILTESANIAAA